MAEAQPTAPPSADEIQLWYTPQEALRRATAHLGEKFAPEGIWNRIRSGIIRMASHSASEQKESNPVTPYRTPQVLGAWLFRTHTELPEKFWSGDFHFGYEEPPPEAASMDIATVLATPELRYKFKFVHVEVFGVRLNKEDVDREFPTQSSAAVPATAPATPGGRPRAAFWDDLFVEMFRRIHFGDFKPTRQADIERAMLDWATANNVEVNESTVRPRAAKLWKALKEEG